jgi:hypothetical protein
MILKLVGTAGYRGQVGPNWVELQRDDMIEVGEEEARGLLEFPGWFEVIDGGPDEPAAHAAPPNGERQARPARDRMQRGGRNRSET